MIVPSYRIFNRAGDIGLSPDRADFDCEDERLCLAVYTSVRAYIHLDSRGRSRSFQALYAFYRSMWLVSVMLAIFYLVYALARVVPWFSFPYVSHAAAVQAQGAVFLLLPLVLFAGGYTTFRHAKASYRKIYTRYLIADFLSITEST